MHEMLCHKTNEQSLEQRRDNVLICQGWIRVMQFSAPGVRIAALRGRVTLQEIDDTKTVKLFKSFEAMLRANRIPIPRRNKYIPEHALRSRIEINGVEHAVPRRRRGS
jgi:hypothetical protein